MEHFVTRELLAEANKVFFKAREGASEYTAWAQNKHASLTATTTSVFLSHKHDEGKLVRDAIALFRSLGVRVYVDVLDDEMPPRPNAETARRLKDKIRSNDKFVLLASDAAVASKWCNWELGLGDAAKYHEHIAILPAASRGKAWLGTEYLGLYPIITTAYEYHPGTYFVEFRGKKIALEQWLKRR